MDLSESNQDPSTEEKIKKAARKVFYNKGFAATRTRDIAEEAGINLALLNYYFRSKQKLFEIILLEALSRFFQNIRGVLNDDRTTLDQKIQIIAHDYIDFILAEPEIPIFLLSEVRNNPKRILSKMPVRELLTDSVYFHQHREAVQNGRIAETNPLHFIVNVMGLIVFPFIAKPILMEVNHLQTSDFIELMQERKKLIPIWIKLMMQSK